MMIPHRSRALLLVTGLALSVGLLFWLIFESARGTPGDAAAPAQIAADGSGTEAPPPEAQAGGASAGTERVEPTRTEVAPQESHAATDTGSLVVHVRWSDQTDAPDIAVQVTRYRRGQPYRILAREITGPDGRCRFDALPAGQVELWTDRGDGKRVEIQAQQEQHAELVLAGVDVEGTVRTAAGERVANASIWLTTHQMTWAGGRIVGRTDAEGAFRLRAVPKDQSLGALVPGYAPSPLVDLETLDASATPVRVELVVEARGGALRGRVVDAGGTAVARALVAVGSQKYHVDHGRSGNRTERWAARTVTTGADGLFELDSLAPGTHTVEVWSREHPFWHSTCTIELGATAQLDVRLEAGVTLHGLVLGEDRLPLEGAIVRAFPRPIDETFLQGGQYDFDSIFGYPFAIAGADGRYELRNAVPGTIEAYAGPGTFSRELGSVVWDHAKLDATPGARIEWNPVLDPGATIEGVVLYRDGAPMKAVFVTALVHGKEYATQHMRAVLVTDAHGRFRFVRLEPQAYDVSVQLLSAPPDQPPLQQQNVWPGQEPLRFVVNYDAPVKQAPGKVRGRVLDAGARLGAAARGVILRTENEWRVGAKWDGDAFEFDKVPPGKYRVSILADEQPVYVGPEFELAAGEDRDVGIVTTEGAGSLIVQIEREPGTETVELTLSLRGEDGGWRSAKAGADRECRIDNLTPGSMQLAGYGNDIAVEPGAQVTIRAGTEVRAMVRIRAARLCSIEIACPDGERLAQYSVADEQGRRWTHAQRLTRPLPNPHMLRVRLPPGRYTAQVATASGRSAEAAFVVEAGAPPVPVARVTFR